MRLWLISQEEVGGYDTFDAAVVAAETEEEARDINPQSAWGYNGVLMDWDKAALEKYSTWAQHREAVSVKLLGDAAAGTSAGVVLASFNAG